MKALRWTLWFAAVVVTAALVGGWGLAIAAAATLFLTRLVLAGLEKRLTGGFAVGAALILGAGFGFSAVLAVSAFLPQFPVRALITDSVFLQQGYAGWMLLAGLTALVQAVAGGWRVPGYLGFAAPPKAFRGLPMLFLTAALVLLALAGFSGLRF